MTEPRQEDYNRDDDFRADHKRWKAAQASGKTYHDKGMHQALQPAVEHDKGYAEGYRHGQQAKHDELRGAQFSGLQAVGRVLRGIHGGHKMTAPPVKLRSISRTVSAKPRRGR